MINHKGTVVIRTERLILRPFRLSDAEDMYHNWASDPEVPKYVSWDVHESPAFTRELLKSWISEYEKPDYYNWTLEYGGEVIGNAAVIPKDKREAAELGYSLSRRFWNRGIMTEAVSAITDFLFGEIGYHRLCIRNIRENPASGRVAEKCGYTLEREGFLAKDGRFHDILSRSLLRDEWERQKADAGDTVRTERLLLRPPRPEDFDAISAYAGNPDTTKYMLWGPNKPGDTKLFIRRAITDWARETPRNHDFVIERTEDGAVIGGCTLCVTDELGEIGWVLTDRYRHQGYAAEAGRGLLRYGFNGLGLHRIRARCDARNLPSYRVMERIGMRREAEFKSTRFSRDEWHDEYESAILKEEGEC